MNVEGLNLYDNLEIIDLGTPDWLEELILALPIRVQKSIKHAAHGFGNIQPFASVFENVMNTSGKTIIVEKKYIDTDFLSEFRAFYGPTYKPHQKECIRLHFFAENAEIIKNNKHSLKQFQEKYLGFSIVRDIEAFFTGRTVITPPSGNSNEDFHLCQLELPVNLSGSSLIARGTPFIQQDTNVGACAQACLWMMSFYMHQKFHEFPRLTPAEISTSATRFITFDDPGIGLQPHQIAEGIKSLGLRPRTFQPTLPFLEKALYIYSYIESEIPVILWVRTGQSLDHVVLAVGHDYIPQMTFRDNWDSTLNGSRHNIEFVTSFFIQDDADGPYKELPIFNRSTLGRSIEGSVAYIFVPHPPEVNLSACEVYTHSKKIINNINELLPDEHKFTAEGLQNLFLRSYLIRSNEYKKLLEDEILGPDKPKFCRLLYRSLPMPKYIWITEISKEALLRENLAEERKIVGEIVFDSTANRYVPYDSFLVFHLFGRYLIRDPDPTVSAAYSFISFLDEQPYPHRVRKKGITV